jgi:toxin ParE1/3/4
VKPVIIHSRAIEELDHSVFYYEKQKTGLGLDFLSEVQQALGKIQQNPSLGTIYKTSGLRRYVLQRYPFLIFYAEFDEFIWIVAIAHGKRKPGYWKGRQLE